jgi:hypothetical protein
MGRLLDRGWTIEDMRRHSRHDLLIASVILDRVDVLKNPPPSDEDAIHYMLKSDPDTAAAINRFFEEKEKLYAGPVPRPSRDED